MSRWVEVRVECGPRQAPGAFDAMTVLVREGWREVDHREYPSGKKKVFALREGYHLCAHEDPDRSELRLVGSTTRTLNDPASVPLAPAVRPYGSLSPGHWRCPDCEGWGTCPFCDGERIFFSTGPDGCRKRHRCLECDWGECATCRSTGQIA